MNKDFDKLTQKRRELVSKLKDPVAKGVWNMVIDKYSEPAHFIVELLQNADDAKATNVEISIFNNVLIFKHNGKIQFSLQDPDHENNSKQTGHINALTSIGASTKTDNETIGKFGIGFKSVFQYTDKPYIEDDNFAFFIEDFIVPVATTPHSEQRRRGETIFELPIKANCNVHEITERLSKMDALLPFLREIKTIHTVADNVDFTYEKKIERSFAEGEITYQKIFTQSKNNITGYSSTIFFHSFSQTATETKLKNIVAYRCNQDGTLVSVSNTELAYCYFPTKEETGLHLLICAPFLLTDSRENIKSGNAWNNQIIAECANLAAKGLRILIQKLGYLLTIENILSVIPLSKESSNINNLFLEKFYEEYVNLLSTDQLILSDDGIYVKASETCHCKDDELRRLYNSDVLCKLNTSADPLHWAFSNLQPPMLNYLRKNNLIRKEFDIYSLLKLTTRELIENADKAWLIDLYQYLSTKSEDKDYCQQIAHSPIFLTDKGEAMSALDENDNPNLFYECNEGCNHRVIHNHFTDNRSIRHLFSNIGIIRPQAIDEIQLICPKYDSPADLAIEKIAADLNLILSYFEKITFDETKKKKLYKLLFDIKIFPCVSSDGKKSTNCANEIFIPGKDIETFLKNYNRSYFIDNDFITNYISPERRESFYMLFTYLGGHNGLRFEHKDKKITAELAKKMELKPLSLRQTDNGAQEVTDIEIFGFDHFIDNITEEKSIAFYNLIAKEIEKSTTYLFRTSLIGKYRYVEKGKKKFTEENLKNTSAFVSIFNSKWLYGKDGKRHSPSEELDSSQLSDFYDFSKSDILFFFGITFDVELAGLTERQRRAMLIIRAFEKAGITMEQLEENVKTLINKKNDND